MKYLFIAEKPSLMREVQSCYKNHSTEIKSKVGAIDFVALAGHACRNGEPDDYPAWNGKWNDISYPMIPSTWKIKPIKDKQAILKKIKQAAPSYDGIIVGTDSDTEGYGIYYLVEHYLGLQNMKALRFMEHSLTDKEILQSLLSMTDYHTDPVHVRYTQSFLLRSYADWLYGMNATRLASVNTGHLLTIGRVKTPTLKLVYDNSMAIENFKPETYYQMQADYGTFKAVMIDKEGHPARFEKPEADIAVPLDGVVFDKKEAITKTHAPKLYDLPSLQMDAGQMFGYSPKKTLELVQSLYEKHKVVSYPRTQCRYVSSEKAKEFPDMLKKVAVFSDLAPFLKQVTNLSRIMKDRQVVNDAEVAKESHDALLPTAKTPILSEMTNDEITICKLIYTKFLAQFLPPLTEKKTKMDLKHGEYLFRVNGKVVSDLGWRVLYGPLKDNVLPDLKIDDIVHAKEMKYLKLITKPPKRLTQATLIAAMERIANSIEDEKLRASLADSKGIGTPATRDRIIHDLITRGYILDKKGLYITTEGKTYIETLINLDIISPVFAAKLDYEIKKIQRGEATYDAVYKMMLHNLQETCNQLNHLEVIQSKNLYPKGVEFEFTSGINCPFCKKDVKINQYGCFCDCGLKIFRNIAGKKISDKDFKILLEKGKTPIKKNFKKKNGDTFDAGLQLTADKNIGFYFE